MAETSLLSDLSQRLSLAYSGLPIVYKLLAVVVIAGLIHRAIFKKQKHSLFPGWAAIEIALVSYFLSQGGLGQRIYSGIRRRNGSLFGLTATHQVLANLPNVDRIMSQPHHTLSAEPVQYTLVTRVFGAGDSPELKKKLEDSWKDLLAPVERMFLNDSAATSALEKSGIPQKASSFVSFSSNPAQMKRWELSANVRLITPDLPGQPGAVEADLQSLSRDFGACIAIPLLYGQDFLDRCSGLLDDFWKFDNDLFPLLMIGVPSWTPFKVIKDGVAARSRLLQEMEALYRRIDQFQRGQAVDFGADMSDTSEVALGRNAVYSRQNWSFRDRAGGDLGVLWGQNANTQPVLFWLLVYVYSTSGVLDRVREEIAPYVKISSRKDPDTDNHTPEITTIDIQGLGRDCALLKACIFETYRLTNEPTSIRYVARPITIHDGTYQHELQPGTFVSAPHSLTQRDPSVYADPNDFIPDRFLQVVDPESGKLRAAYGKALRPWGSGAAMCKGRTFAEKELVVLGAAIIGLWDIKPAAGGCERWEVPAMIPGTGVKKPVRDIRVRISRRGF
ncbi:uncharacterized protein Z520_11962 [Fonsecaea multimorphosa CBS 102226]|uniref:Cytochrome P450 n=1 Tax=Fonsecaea multimorphosa CBS 102226 TaxID=1442371 RepID=A0A0D2JPG6_9EURO|nr:uncharacterized protein Z520_11962 [Fonsecaea multimorphosa CBS 102226]KIX92354.1 hypothetical protein Z520_11962 [Fonsecaea multimorphosa CBS 102226]OAL17727.1 hypothetical protein AYO22_11383 [Fonsecaea multimorphosa]